MTENEAFIVIEKATAPFLGTRNDHALIAKALSVLKALIPEEEKKEKID